MSTKLICSDIDGTLLQYGKKELEDEIFEQIREFRGVKSARALFTHSSPLFTFC